MSASLEDVARAYIDNQEEHHKKQTFKDELREFFRKHRTAFDENRPWDRGAGCLTPAG